MQYKGRRGMFRLNEGVKMQLALIFLFEVWMKLIKNVLNTGMRGLKENMKSKWIKFKIKLKDAKSFLKI